MAIVVFNIVPFKIQANYPNTYISFIIKETKASEINLITVEDAGDSTVGKIHERLSKGKAVNLKVRGNESESKRLLNEVNNNIKKINRQGVIFKYKKSKNYRGYTYYTVNSDQAGTYQYAVKYIKKLYTLLREDYKKSQIMCYYNDLQLYPDEYTRELRWAYDYVIDGLDAYVWIDEFDEGTYDARTTSLDVYLNDFLDYDSNKEVYDQVVKNITYTYTIHVYGYIDGRKVELKIAVLDYVEPLDEESEDSLLEHYGQEAYNMGASNYSIDIDTRVHASACSFEEFCKLPIAPKLAKRIVYDDWSITDANLLICKTKDFCDLSDAMKVYAIDSSEYFSCNYIRPKYGMIYKRNVARYHGKNGMKKLYYNKVAGVCEAFATYECQVWDALGIKNYSCCNYTISHAWSVVKVKNSVGKIMWIPYDYGIGPDTGLAVSDAIYNKYLRTEAMRYKLYLANIKGAPKKKNFKDEDFK